MRLVVPLLLISSLAGCHRASATSKSKSPVMNPGPIIVRAEYHQARGPCIHGEDGSWAMPVMDHFRVLEVSQGHLATSGIDVRPLTGQSQRYPQSLTIGQVLTLRLNLSEESSKQARENERAGYGWLVVDGDEIEQVTAP